MAQAIKPHEMSVGVEEGERRGHSELQTKATSRTHFLVVPICISTHRSTNVYDDDSY